MSIFWNALLYSAFAIFKIFMFIVALGAAHLATEYKRRSGWSVAERRWVGYPAAFAASLVSALILTHCDDGGFACYSNEHSNDLEWLVNLFFFLLTAFVAGMEFENLSTHRE
jgi:hypothetical protein